MMKWHMLQWFAARCNYTIHLKHLTQRNTRRNSSPVDPEGHPWQHDHQSGRKVRLKQEEEDMTTQSEVDVKTIVPTCREDWREKPSQF